MRILASLLVLAAACGGNKAATSTPTNETKSAAGTSDGGVASADGGSKDEKPFAGSAAEATSLISAVVDKKQEEIATCVRDFRQRKNMAHERVAISFGIDQDGRLLGVTSKGKEDAELKGCVKDVLKSATFPRSHSGVITVTKTYEEIVK